MKTAFKHEGEIKTPTRIKPEFVTGKPLCPLMGEGERLVEAS